MDDKVLTVREQLDLLFNGEAHGRPCDYSQCLDLEMDLPPWFDKGKYKRGQDYILRNIFGQFFVTLCGLISVLSVPSILTILIASKKSCTEMSAYRRYLSTMKHIYSWYHDELKPGTTAWKSLMAVRGRHLRASKTSERNGGIHISQRDMVLTQFSFFGYGLLKPHIVGLQHDNAEDIEGYVHFWRTIGYMMGIDDRYNMCRQSLEETKELTQAICSEAYSPLLQNPPEYFVHMSTKLLEGLWHLMPVLTVKSQMYITYTLAEVPGFYTLKERKEGKVEQLEDKMDHNMNKLRNIWTEKDDKVLSEYQVKGDEYYETLDWFDRMTLWFCFTVFGSWLTNVVARIYFNFQIKIIMFFVEYFPFLCFYRFGWRLSFVNMFVEDIPMECKPKTNMEMMKRSKNNVEDNNEKVLGAQISTLKVAKNVN